MNNTNPSTYFGGTWSLIAPGRVLVGVDTAQAEFNTVNKTGGSKYTEAHKHPFRVVKDSNSNSGGGLPKANNAEGANSGWSAYVPDTDSNCAVGTFGTGAAGNLQPFLTCYIWNRIA
jgi:hypothetical protein